MKITSAMVSETIYKALAEYENMDVGVAMSGVALVLSNLSIVSGIRDDVSVEAFRNTLRNVREMMDEESSGSIH